MWANMSYKKFNREKECRAMESHSEHWPAKEDFAEEELRDHVLERE